MSAINYIKSEYGNPNNIANLYSGDYKGYANGTDFVPDTGLAMVGEDGPELNVLQRGSGMLTHTVTQNLMQWGKLSPQNISSGMLAQFGTPTLNSGGSVNNNVANNNSVNITGLTVVADSADDLFTQLKVRANVK
jgi:SLT domain-containing protein